MQAVIYPKKSSCTAKDAKDAKENKCMDSSAP